MADSLPRTERLTDDRPALVACRHCNGYIVDNGGWRMTHTEPFRQVTIICDACVQAAIDLGMAVTLAHAEEAAADMIAPTLPDIPYGFGRELPDTECCSQCETRVPFGDLYILGGDFGPNGEDLWVCGDCSAQCNYEIYDASSVDYGRYVL